MVHSVYLAAGAGDLGGLPALAEQGQDITANAVCHARLKEKRQLALTEGINRLDLLRKGHSRDRHQAAGRNQTGGIYLCFAADPDTLVVLSGNREILASRPGLCPYLPFESDHPLTVQINSHAHVVSISEIFVFSGSIACLVQRWQPSLNSGLAGPGGAPDDELLMGGAISLCP